MAIIKKFFGKVWASTRGPVVARLTDEGVISDNQAHATARSCNYYIIPDTMLSLSEPRLSVCKTHLCKAVLKSTSRPSPAPGWLIVEKPFFVVSSPASHCGKHFSNSSNTTFSLLHAVMTDSWITQWTCPESQVFTGRYGLFFYFPRKETLRK